MSERKQKHQTDWKIIQGTRRSEMYCVSANGKINKTSRKATITPHPQDSLLCLNKINLQIHRCKTNLLMGNKAKLTVFAEVNFCFNKHQYLLNKLLWPLFTCSQRY